MKAIGISSSGRKDAYSKIIVKDILNEAEVEYEMINLAELDIRGCIGCLQCVKDNKCVVEDDFQSVIDKIEAADALVFGGGNYYGTLNAIGHAFWERTFALRHRGAFPLAGKLSVAVGLDRSKDNAGATKFIEQMMLSNKMSIVASFTDPGHFQCYDCGYGHDCVAGGVYVEMGIVSVTEAAANRPEEYCSAAKKRAKGVGRLLGSILKSRYTQERNRSC